MSATTAPAAWSAAPMIICPNPSGPDPAGAVNTPLLEQAVVDLGDKTSQYSGTEGLVFTISRPVA